MASVSISPRARPTAAAPIVLPSIHEMFPEHMLIPRAARPRATATPIPCLTPPSPQRAPVNHPSPSYSFDVLKSDPRGSSLQHIASSRPRPSRPVVRTNTNSNSGPGPSPTLRTAFSDGDTEMDVVDVDEGEEEPFDGFPEESRRHVCPTCWKRFNRPSSLRIHVNTHTGAMPFRCPHPNCGRAFNVNSNMRRHLRNHANPSSNPGFSTSTSMPSPSSPSPSPAYTHSASESPRGAHSYPYPAERWTVAPAPWTLSEGEHYSYNSYHYSTSQPSTAGVFRK